MNVLILSDDEKALLTKLMGRLTTSASTTPGKDSNVSVTNLENRSSGYELFGCRQETKTVADAFYRVFQQLAHVGPDYFPKISSMLLGKGRKRSILARTRSDLYGPGTSRYQAMKWSRRIRSREGDWYLDTNLSTPRKVRVIKDICGVLDIQYGNDVRLYGKNTGSQH